MHVSEVAPRDQKNALDPLDLELQVVVSCLTGNGLFKWLVESR